MLEWLEELADIISFQSQHKTAKEISLRVNFLRQIPNSQIKNQSGQDNVQASRMNFLRQIKNEVFVVMEQVVATCCLFVLGEDFRFLDKLAGWLPDLNHKLLLSYEQHRRHHWSQQVMWTRESISLK